jgi:mediator of RNA polymerase II transcription subunit 7
MVCLERLKVYVLFKPVLCCASWLTYYGFQLSTTLPSLTEQGIEQLYPSPSTTDTGNEHPPPLNHACYLLKISKSLLLNFLEFVGVLSVAPEQFEPKLEDLRNLFINAHHLLNLYRPHQARESLILMMEEQLDRAREEIREMDRVKEHVESLLQRLRRDAMDAAVAISYSQKQEKDGTELDEKVVEEARQVWSLLNEDASG